MVQVSEDIFYQVKKQILDKLDIVLQKVNLQIINYVHPNEDSFSFIELSSFQTQLQNLFHYLDRLYTSLNSSVSFSSINTYKSTAQTYQVQNQKLKQQVQKLRSYIKDFGNEETSVSKSIIDRHVEEQRIMKRYCKALNNQIKILASQMTLFSKQVKAILKSHKFQSLQARIEIISKLKEFENNNVKKKRVQNLTINDLNQQQSQEQILNKINQILLIC